MNAPWITGEHSKLLINMVMRAFLLDVAIYTPITKDFLLPLDNIKVLRFYDFALILPMVSSCYQQYSVSPSEGKLIPNSALFIYHFVSFTPGF